MILSDTDINKAIARFEIQIEPYFAEQINPASYDLTLAHEYRIPDLITGQTLDCREVRENHTLLMRASPDENGHDYILLKPGDFILASTVEEVTLDNKTVARVEGKSSLGRLGLAIHVTAGFIDPGFAGTVTLEIANLSPWMIFLRPGQRIAQIAFEKTSSPVMKDYSQKGHYQNQSGPTESRFKM